MVEVAEGMVDLAVLGLVGPDIEHQVANGSMTLGHIPVPDGNLGRFELLPFGQFPTIDIGNDPGVRQDCFF